MCCGLTVALYGPDCQNAKKNGIRPLIAKASGVFRTAAVGSMQEIVQKMSKKGKRKVKRKVKRKRCILQCLKTGEYACKIGNADRRLSRCGRCT